MHKLTNCIADGLGVLRTHVRDTQGLCTPKKVKVIIYISMCLNMIAYLGYSRDLFCVSSESCNRDNFSVDLMDPDLSTCYKLLGLDDGSLLGQHERRL
jgi:hypothetical protein